MLPGVDHARLTNIVARIVGRQDADDVVQMAYVRMLRFVPEGVNLEAWSTTVAKNEAYTFLRQNRREGQLSPPDGESRDGAQEKPRPAHVDDPREPRVDKDPGITEFELRSDSARKLKNINPQWAEALLVYHRLGSLEDAAAHLGITVTALKKRMFQGRKALRT